MLPRRTDYYQVFLGGVLVLGISLTSFENCVDVSVEMETDVTYR